jgi:hypothetical protein
VAPFDPISIDADALHRIVDDCLERDIIEKGDPRAMMAIYPLSISEPEPLLSVNPGCGPMLLGGQAVYRVSEEEASTPEDRSVIALRALVEDANALYAESELARRESKDGGAPREEFIRLIYTEEDVRQWAADSDGRVDEEVALQRAREWGRHIQDTAALLCSEQLMGAVLDDQP